MTSTASNISSNLFSSQTTPTNIVTHYVGINQEQSCFVCSTETGFHVFNLDPLRERCHIDLKVPRSVYKAEMLHRTNLVAVIGGGSTIPQDTVVIWDDYKKRFILEFKCSAPVAAVCLRRDRIVIVLASQIFVYSFPTQSPTLLYSSHTIHNPEGVCALSSCVERGLLAFPSKLSGKVQLIDITHVPAGVTASPVNLEAHKHDIAYLSINTAGTMLASASIQGTLIRLFNVERLSDKPKQIMELRRGSDMAHILCINFSLDSRYLCVSSDKGTVHIFSVDDSNLNKKSKLAPVIQRGSYINSLWALANFTLPTESPCQCCFSGPQSVTAVCLDGTCYRYIFTTDGTCTRESFDKFIDPEDEEF